MHKARFWEALKEKPLNERQRKVLTKMLGGLERKLMSSKWANLTNASPDTALRNITDLVERGVLVKDDAGGTQYELFTGRVSRLIMSDSNCT